MCGLFVEATLNVCFVDMELSVMFLKLHDLRISSVEALLLYVQLALYQMFISTKKKKNTRTKAQSE